MDIEINELIRLKENGMADAEIVNHFSKQGKRISLLMVSIKIAQYYEELNKRNINNSIPKTSQKKKTREGNTEKEITDKELADLKEQGMTCSEIVQQFTRQGKRIGQTTVWNRLTEYYEEQGVEIPRVSKSPYKNYVKASVHDSQYESLLKQMLMSGMTVGNLFPEGGEQAINLKKDLEKLRLVVLHFQEKEGRGVGDSDFEFVIECVTGSHKLDKYESSVKPLIRRGRLKLGALMRLKDLYFEGNEDLTVYVLTRLDLEYHKDKDVKDFEHLRKKYEEKIDKYLERLNSIEENRRKRKTNSENGSNSEVEVEGR